VPTDATFRLPSVSVIVVPLPPSITAVLVMVGTMFGFQLPDRGQTSPALPVQLKVDCASAGHEATARKAINRIDATTCFAG
jgi:hypothetical protein